MRGLRPLKDELGFAQRRAEELGRRLVEQDAAVQQLSASNKKLLAKVDELLTAKQQLQVALATARSSVTAQEQLVANMLERFSATAFDPELAAKIRLKGPANRLIGIQKNQQRRGLRPVCAEFPGITANLSSSCSGCTRPY